MTHCFDLERNYLSFSFLIDVRGHSYSLAAKRLAYAFGRLSLFVSQQTVFAEQHGSADFHSYMYQKRAKFFEV